MRNLGSHDISNEGRYCIAISCTDLLKKMNEIEEENM